MTAPIPMSCNTKLRKTPLNTERNEDAQFTTTHRVFNHTGVDLEIVNRFGMCVKCPTSRDLRTSGELVVRVEYLFHRDVQSSFEKWLQHPDMQKSVFVKLAKESYRRENSTSSRYKCEFDIVIPYTEIVRHGSTVYVTELDLLFRIAAAGQEPVYHPFSPEGVMMGKQIRASEAEFGVDYVFNGDQERKLYHRIGIGNVRIIRSIRDDNRENGVWLRIPEYKANVLSEPMLYTERMDDNNIDRLKSFDLFISYEDAANLITAEEQHKERMVVLNRELAELRGDLESKKHQNEIEKQKMETEELELKTALAREEARLKEIQIALEDQKLALKQQEMAMANKQAEMDQRKRELEERDQVFKAQQHKWEVEHASRKHEHDMKHLERKDTSDVINYVPKLIIGAVGLFAAILALA